MPKIAAVKNPVPKVSKTAIRQNQAKAKKLIYSIIQKELKARDWSLGDLSLVMKKNNPLPSKAVFTDHHNFTLDSIIELEMGFGIQFLSDDFTTTKKKSKPDLKKIKIRPDYSINAKSFAKQKLEVRKQFALKVRALFKEVNWRWIDVSKAIPDKNASYVLAWIHGKRNLTLDSLIEIEMGLGIQIFAKPITTAKKSRINELKKFKRAKQIHE